ncbi:hypothetical protein SFBM_0191 [Candidatus Arthromitus sp. SFB-mouse-Japan]|nr:hypothetical protein SFB1_233G1 [Candidatus Arthromitus sp. SFB-1]BAK55970.1 hypothetical protein SFBM_0191 [Candidatus Arthromitus sp. SFB-mouse-Japan]
MINIKSKNMYFLLFYTSFLKPIIIYLNKYLPYINKIITACAKKTISLGIILNCNSKADAFNAPNNKDIKTIAIGFS